jgi:DNA-binding winged helix-turn-helix (wHTH) protein
MTVHFAEFTFDGERRMLTRGGSAVPLAKKTFDLLELLVRERPHALSKERIRDHLWPQTFVSESTLNGLVAELRAALGDSAREPRYVRTIHGFGYGFAAAVTPGDPWRASPAYVADSALMTARLLWDGRVIPLEAGENVLGRHEDAGVRIVAPSVSRRHACIRIFAGEPATVEDLGSKNGTWVGGRRLQGERATLSNRAIVRVGRVELVFLDSKELGPTETAEY